jgi:TonB family protein
MIIPPFISGATEVNIFAASLDYVVSADFIADYSAVTGPVTSIQSVLMIIWLIVLVVFMLIFILNLRQIARIAHDADQIDITRYVSSIPNNKIILLKSRQNHSPFVIGVFRFRIVVPADWDDWSWNYRQLVVVHELNHIKNHDTRINMLKSVLQAIHFFNPFVWVLIKKYDLCTEKICDDSTIGNLDINHSHYLRNLLAISESIHLARQKSFNAISFSESFHTFKNRIIYQIKKQENQPMKIISAIPKVISAGMIAAMIPFLWQCNEDNSSRMFQTRSDTGIQDIRDVQERPVILTAVEPDYPVLAREKGISGFVQVEVVIDEFGQVESAEIMRSVPELDAAALDAAKKYKFSPAKKDGVPVKVKWNIPFTFDLDFIDLEAAHQANLYQFHEASVKPKIIKKANPVYPEEALKNKIQGMVVVTVTIDEEGNSEKSVIYMSTNSVLNHAALDAAEQCKFEPGQLNGQPVRVKVNIPFRFKLE